MAVWSARKLHGTDSPETHEPWPAGQTHSGEMVKSLKQVSHVSAFRRGQRAGPRWPAAGRRCVPRGSDGSGKCHSFIFPHRPAGQGHRATEPRSGWPSPAAMFWGLPRVSGGTYTAIVQYQNGHIIYHMADFIGISPVFPLMAFFFLRNQSRTSHSI